jgi:hypothetical protein
MTSSSLLLAGSPSSLSGRVLAPNGADPRAGVVVALVEPATERAFRSSPTDAKGAFTIDTAPAGNYAVIIEAPEGAFMAASQVQLAPGVNRPVSLALKPGRASGGTPPASGGSTGGGMATWTKWVIAGGVIIGGAIVVNAVTQTSDSEASSF